MPPKNTPNLNQPVKKSSWPGFSPTISILLIVVVALIIGAGLYYLNAKTKSSNTNSTVSLETNRNAVNNSNQVLGGDADEHGCIGSAGYSWCAAKSKCLRIWEEECPTGTNGNVNGNTNINSNTNANTNLNSNLKTNANTNTAGWQTYTDSEYGYSFMYPTGLTISLGTRRQVANNVYDLVSASVPGSNTKTNRQVHVAYYDWVFNPNNLQGLYGPISEDSISVVTVDGQTGYYYPESSAGTRIVHIQVVAKNGKVLVFEFEGGEGGDYNPWFYDAAQQAEFVSSIRLFTPTT